MLWSGAFATPQTAFREAEMKKNARKADIRVWLTAPIAILVGIATGAGACNSGHRRDAPTFVPQARLFLRTAQPDLDFRATIGCGDDDSHLLIPLRKA